MQEERIYEAIWSPHTWLHQKQLIDDFVIFTVMTEICMEEGTEFIFNVRQCFRNFIIESMPVLEVSRESNKKPSGSNGQQEKGVQF